MNHNITFFSRYIELDVVTPFLVIGGRTVACLADSSCGAHVQVKLVD